MSCWKDSSQMLFAPLQRQMCCQNTTIKSQSETNRLLLLMPDNAVDLHYPNKCTKNDITKHPTNSAITNWPYDISVTSYVKLQDHSSAWRDMDKN